MRVILQGCDEVAITIHRRKTVARHQRDEWITDLGVEEPIRGDEQRIGAFADEGRQSHVGIALAADVEDTEPQPQSFRTQAEGL